MFKFKCPNLERSTMDSNDLYFEVITKKKDYGHGPNTPVTLDNFLNFRISTTERNKIVKWLTMNNVTVTYAGDYSISCKTASVNFAAIKNGFLNNGEVNSIAIPAHIRDFIFDFEAQETVTYL
jgi:hypothetical protein